MAVKGGGYEREKVQSSRLGSTTLAAHQVVLCSAFPAVAFI